MKSKILDNDSFVRTNLGRLVKKYPRQLVVICKGKVFTGDDALKKAKRKYPQFMPLLLPVPGPEEFTHIL